jgi:8-oxo-dGTP pyrophosphatase MutT (NUDIX family)
MNDVVEPVQAKWRGVRPRDAASLIVLRGAAGDLEVLAGRRPLSVRFMPGVWVFPGGAIDLEDGRPWAIERGAETLPRRLVRCARGALRETWEEIGVLVGRRDPAAAPKPGRSAIERAYAEGGVAAAFDQLTYIGRAITPARAPRRFNTRFFLADGSAVIGEPAPSEELEEAGWHSVGRVMREPLADVTQFMLTRAIALRAGTAPIEPQLFYTVQRINRIRRIRPCREGAVIAGGSPLPQP